MADVIRMKIKYTIHYWSDNILMRDNGSLLNIYIHWYYYCSYILNKGYLTYQCLGIGLDSRYLSNPEFLAKNLEADLYAAVYGILAVMLYNWGRIFFILSIFVLYILSFCLITLRTFQLSAWVS